MFEYFIENFIILTDDIKQANPNQYLSNIHNNSMSHRDETQIANIDRKRRTLQMDSKNGIKMKQQQ